MFAYCQSLDSTVLPQGTEIISDYAFYGSGLKSITLPESLNYIGNMAFAECSTLDEINNLSDRCDVVSDNAFSGTPAGNPYEETNGITVYLTISSEWENAYVYGFYGDMGDSATGEPLGEYPGIPMTLAKRTSDGVETYRAQIPADIDYIKFSDGSLLNNRTANISNSELVHNRGFRITEKSDIYWDYETYEYAITIYFANHLSWTDLEVNYLSPDSDSVSDWRSAPITFFETNSFGQDIYKAEIPPKLEFVSLTGYSDSGDFVQTKITTPENGYGYYITQLKTGVSDYDRYKYDPNINPLEPEAATKDEEGNTITIYFTSAEVWEDAYVYGFYGDSYESKTGEPLGTYPGTKMTYYTSNDYGQKIYSAKIPSDIDYIKFSDGSSENRCTDYITSKHFTDNIIFYTYFLKGEYWDTDFFPFVDNNSFFGVAPEERINVYFTNNKNWENVYIYASYNTPDTEIKTELFGTYPGMKMNCIGKNSSGDEIYCAKISISTHYIVFSDGTSGTNKTDNIITTDITNIYDKNFGFCLTDMASTYWNHERYVFGVDQSVETVNIKSETTVQPVGASSSDETVVSTSDEISGVITEEGILMEAPFPEVVRYEKGLLAPVSAIVNEDIDNKLHYVRDNSRGDADGDGKISIKDATTIQKYEVFLITFSRDELKNADANADFDVNIKDATLIQKLIAGLISEFP